MYKDKRRGTQEQTRNGKEGKCSCLRAALRSRSRRIRFKKRKKGGSTTKPRWRLNTINGNSGRGTAGAPRELRGGTIAPHTQQRPQQYVCIVYNSCVVFDCVCGCLSCLCVRISVSSRHRCLPSKPPQQRRRPPLHRGAESRGKKKMQPLCCQTGESPKTATNGACVFLVCVAVGVLRMRWGGGSQEREERELSGGTRRTQGGRGGDARRRGAKKVELKRKN